MSSTTLGTSPNRHDRTRPFCRPLHPKAPVLHEDFSELAHSVDVANEQISQTNLTVVETSRISRSNKTAIAGLFEKVQKESVGHHSITNKRRSRAHTSPNAIDRIC